MLSLSRDLRIGVFSALLVAVAATASAADCLVEAASFARAQSRPLRLTVLPPRVHVIGESKPGASGPVAKAPVLAAMLVPEVHCALEDLGYEVDAHSLANPDALWPNGLVGPLGRDIDFAWQSLRRLTRRACDPGEILKSGAGIPEAWSVAHAVDADALVFVQALTLTRSKGFRRFVRAIETVAPDINWPGASDDLTWVEIAIVDGRTGELLSLTAAVIENRLARNPREIAVDAVHDAVAVIPRRDEPSAWGAELLDAGLTGLEFPPRCLLSTSSRRQEFERRLQRVAGAREIDGR